MLWEEITKNLKTDNKMKNIKIKIHPNSSQEKVSVIDKNEYEIWIKEKPVEGKANIYLEKFLKRYFKKQVRIISGFNSRKKVVEVED